MTERETARLIAWSSELRQAHGRLREALNGRAPADLDRHLDGIGAIMENHFVFEERQLLRVLETLALDADPHDVLGNL